MQTLIYIRNSILHFLYTRALKPLYFRLDPERVHDAMTRVGKVLGATYIGRSLTSILFGFKHPSLSQTILGMTFVNPIGLSAGFDKNAELTDIIPSVGFSFEEVGSITGAPCAGNPRPRLWRLPHSKSLVVYYGLKNDGCEAIAQRLAHKQFYVPIGMSVAMTNCQANLDTKLAVLDYVHAFRTMEPLASYMTINISCPNTLGGQPFVEPHKLDYLLDMIDTVPTTKPIFVKLSPDMSTERLHEVLNVLHKHRVHGIIASNLTKPRNNPAVHDTNIPEKGGLSGKPVAALADTMIAEIFRREGKRYVIIGCGGVFSAEDAYTKIRLGASLIHMITGMIYEGPQVVSEINRGLVQLLRRDGFSSVSQAIGVDCA